MDLYHPVNIGPLELDGNLFLAPVAGYTDRGFRSLCVEQGANFSFTELVSAEALYRNPGHYGLANADAVPAAVNLVKRAVNEKRYAIQLFAGEPEAVYKAALLLAPLGPDAVDINAGCPVPKVVKNGAGSALMKDPARLGRVVEAAVRASREALGDAPVTVKIRSGWDSHSINYAECARIAAEAGAAMVSLHPRTRGQNYGGTSNWSHIADLVSLLAVPVTGSGDLYTPEDARRMLTETGCAAVMFARGAMGNPFIFSATRSLLENGAWEPPPFSEKIAAAFRHLELLAADIGERAACLEMRKQFCAYTRGLRGGAAIREQAVHARTIADYRGILDTFDPNHYS
uniref:tRNA-dihydrouridine synthase n=1 Tax=uncultured bacterium contig00063 TaxID=1181546 RepID=A0A806KHQ4_9BACT|nr:tRNA dihydrouridine synthase B [uncultured bacterium contig00063]